MQKTNNYNEEQLRRPKTQIAIIKAFHNNNSIAKRASTKKAEGLESILLLRENARIIITRNLWTDVGLCNRTSETIIDIIYKEDNNCLNLPICVLVEFDANVYKGPAILINNKKYISIELITNEWKNGKKNKLSRRQLPIKLAFALTIHKSIG